jgi:hypothetical protein
MITHAFVSIVSLVPLIAAQDSRPAAAPLRVILVAEAGTDRARDFAGFLEQRFGKVEVVPLEDGTTERLSAADVVVLDWPQKGQVGKWRSKQWKSSPLGDREAWTKPVVLIGSAGLNLACAWAVKGGFG